MTDDETPVELDSGRESFARYRELLETYGFRPSRRLGQNFLLDSSLHRVLVDAVAPGPDDLVLEVGPGLGFLTRELAARCRVVAVEVDDRLVQVLRSEIPRFAGGGEGVRLVHADILARSRVNPEVLAILRSERAAQSPGGRFLVVANLPYSIAGPFLAELTTLEDPPAEIVVLIQLEMARRLAAAPNTRDYGALSVQLQLSYTAKLMRKVGAQVFRPRPRVDSAIVHLRARDDGCLRRPAAERVRLARFLRLLFASRRKKLRNAKVLRELGPGLDCQGLQDRRPDAVDPNALLGLWDCVQALGGAKRPAGDDSPAPG